MPEQRTPLFGALRPWIAPAFGTGLVGAGVAIAAGMSSTSGPLVGVFITAIVLRFGRWRINRGQAKP